MLGYPDVTRDIIIDDSGIYLASEGVAISKDHGRNWIIKQRGLGSSYVFDITKNFNSIYAIAYKQGAFVSHDKGNSWSSFIEDFKNSSFEKIQFLDSNFF